MFIKKQLRVILILIYILQNNLNQNTLSFKVQWYNQLNLGDNLLDKTNIVYRVNTVSHSFFQTIS